MSEKYQIESTSSASAKVEDRVLSESPSGTTRKVIRAELIDNPKDPNASVKIILLHQRKKKDDQWEDLPAEPLSKLKAGETVKFLLSSSETRKLVTELSHLYKIFDVKGVPWGERQVVVGYQNEIIHAPKDRARVIKALLEQNHGEEVWTELARANPSLATKLSYARIHEHRTKVLHEFHANLTKKLGEIDYWDDFFQKNTWIFGYGLSYQFMSTIESQPHYGGTAVTGKGAQRGDFLTASAAEIRFTALVEIKTPGTPLLHTAKQYRNGVYHASTELAGGVSQLQVNSRKWVVEGSGTDQNRELLETEQIYTVQPKGILVIGHTEQLGKHDYRNSFELFRRNLSNPDVITFDELYQRAKFIVEHGEADAESG